MSETRKLAVILGTNPTFKAEGSGAHPGKPVQYRGLPEE